MDALQTRTLPRTSSRSTQLRPASGADREASPGRGVSHRGGSRPLAMITSASGDRPRVKPRASPLDPAACRDQADHHLQPARSHFEALLKPALPGPEAAHRVSSRSAFSAARASHPGHAPASSPVARPIASRALAPRRQSVSPPRRAIHTPTPTCWPDAPSAAAAERPRPRRSASAPSRSSTHSRSSSTDSRSTGTYPEIVTPPQTCSQPGSGRKPAEGSSWAAPKTLGVACLAGRVLEPAASCELAFASDLC